jgi:hypothetical protein
VLFAAYRYINGGGLTGDEQKAIVEVWKADFDNIDFRDEDISETIKAWIEKAKGRGRQGRKDARYLCRAFLRRIRLFS